MGMAVVGWGVALWLGATAPPAPVPGYKFKMELADDVRFKMADQKRDEAIEQLKQMIPGFDDASPEKPDLLFQLSEFYWEKHQYLYAQEEKRGEQAIQAWEKAGKRGPQPKADHAPSEQLRAEAMRLYDQILARYPKYERTDEVLFSLAYNLHELGKQGEAVKRYQELIKRYPKSRFVPDTWVQLGDHAFDHNDLEGARSAFQHAADSQDSKLYAYAVYKLAWCDYNAHDFEAAVKKLHQVVDYVDTRSKAQVVLRNEALGDLVLLYVALDQPEQAEKYFAQKAPAARRPRLLIRLADGLAEAGHEESALRIYGELLAEDPLRPEAPILQQAVVRALAKQGKRAQVRAEVKKLGEVARPGGAWWQKNAGNKVALRDAFDAAEEGMRNLSADLHKEAQETKQVETYRLARDVYRQYLDAFGSSADPAWVADAAFNQAFFHAEILWTLEEWEPAYEAYDRVVRFKVPDRPAAKELANESYRKIAAFDAILAADKLLKIERGTLQKSELRDGQKVDEKKGKGGVEAENQRPEKKGAEAEEQPLTRGEERLVKACDQYAQLYPSAQAPAAERAKAVKEEIDIRYQAAVLLYDRNHAAEAAKRFGEIIVQWPDDPRAQAGADLSMSVLEARGQWEELAKLSGELAANKRLVKAGTPFGRRVQRVLEGARYKWIDEVVIKRDKDTARGAEELLKYVRELPRSHYADRALTYAMLLDRDRHELDRAVAEGEQALKEYPGSPLEPKVRYTLCTIYEQLAELPRAAQMAESFIAAYDRRKAAVDALRRSKPEKGSAADAAGDEDAAEKSPKEQLAERVAQETELLREAEAWLPDAQASAAVWYEGLGQGEQAAGAYQRYLARFKDRPDAPQMQYALGSLKERDRKWGEAAKAFERFEAMYGKDSRVKPRQVLLAKYRQMLAWRELKDARRAEALGAEVVRAYQRLGAEGKQDPDATAAYAHARFLALEPLWKEYERIKFTRIATVQRDLEAKRKKLRELEKAYLEVLQLGVGEWGIASLTRVGLAYADIAGDIMDSAQPRGLSEQQLQMYRDELEKLALPLEDQSLEALNKALAKAYELGIYGEWTAAAQEQVNKLKPGTYPKVREVRPPVADASWTAELEKGGGEAGGGP